MHVARFSDNYSYEIYLVHQAVILGSFSVFTVDAVPVPVGILICLCWSVVFRVMLRAFLKLIERPIEQALPK